MRTRRRRERGGWGGGAVRREHGGAEVHCCCGSPRAATLALPLYQWHSGSSPWLISSNILRGEFALCIFLRGDW